MSLDEVAERGEKEGLNNTRSLLGPDEASGQRQKQRSDITWILVGSSAIVLALVVAALYLVGNLVASAKGFIPSAPSLPNLSETAPKVASLGPTVVQLKKLQHLVSSHIHVSDIMVGESRWLEGSWIVQGDALLGVDMSSAEIVSKDEQSKLAVISMSSPKVMSPRVDHQRTREWDIKGKSWIPLSATLLGDKEAMKKAVMQEAQNLVERLAARSEYQETAKKNFEGSIREFYDHVGWNVVIQWH